MLNILKNIMAKVMEIHQNKYEAFLNELNSHPKSYYTKEEIYALADLFSETIKQSNEQSVMSYSFK